MIAKVNALQALPVKSGELLAALMTSMLDNALGSIVRVCAFS
jgi:hypothetical protein